MFLSLTLCHDLAHCIVAARFCHLFDAAILEVLGQSDIYATYFCYMHSDYFGRLSLVRTESAQDKRSGLPCT